MSPADIFQATLYLCGAAALAVVTLAFVCVALVGFVIFAGWLASTFKDDTHTPGITHGVYPSGQPMNIVTFDGGQVGTRPSPTPPNPNALLPTVNGRPFDGSELFT